MRLLSTLLLSLGTTSLVCMGSPVAHQQQQQQYPGVHKMDFNIKRGSNYLDSTYSGKPRFVKRTDDTVEVNLENESSFYLIDLSIGSDNQTIGILIDTGSSDLWVMGSNNPYCESTSSSSSKSVGEKLHARRNGVVLPGHAQNKDIGGGGGGGGPPDIATTTGGDGIATAAGSQQNVQATIDCQEYGTFDESSSSSFRSNNTEFLIQYADYTYAYGDWGYDDVTLGGVTVNDLSFAVANESNSTIGVLGIGLTGLETTYAGSLTQSSYQYANLPVKMVQQGLIHKNAYSLFLDSSDATRGTILFGGIDHSKYSGTIGLVPIINTLESSGYNEPIRLEITLSSISMPTSNDEDTVYITTTTSPALLDSGTTLTYVPSAVMIKIGEALGATYSSSVGAYILECLDSSNTTAIDFNFSGVIISVPVTDLQVQVTSSRGGSSSYCAIGTLSSGDDSYILGDSFLRSAYVVYDLDDLQIGLAQANYNGGSEDIELISSSIPSASSAADYSSTWSTAVYDTNTQLSYSTGLISNSSLTSGSSGSSGSSSSSSSRSSGSSSSDSKLSLASKSDFNPMLVFAFIAGTVVLLGM